MDKKFRNALIKVDNAEDLFDEVLEHVKDGMTITFTPNNVYPNDRFLIFSAWKKHKVTFHRKGLTWLEFDNDEPMNLEDVPQSFLKSIMLNVYYMQEVSCGENKKIDVQALADELTSKVLETKYGERFKKLDNLEDDKELNDEWEYFNEKFYDILFASGFNVEMEKSIKKK